MPKLEKDILLRQRINNKILHMMDYSVVVLSASAGYGKTTALVQVMNELHVAYGWYSPGPEDDNVYSFSSYLAAAIDPYLPGFKAWYLEHISTEELFTWKTAFSFFMSGMEYFLEGKTEPFLLVVDDWQWVHKDPEIGTFFDRFLACKPSELHVALLSREAVALSEIDRLKARDQVLEINVRDLAFSLEEIHQFLNGESKGRYSKQEVKRIYHTTEGWVMAIRLINSASQGASTTIPSRKNGGEYFNVLFEYLVHDVLARQSQEIQNFLLRSSIFSIFSVPICKEVFKQNFRAGFIEELINNSLFINEVEKGFFRYHHLFREFLRREAERKLNDIREIHAKAGEYFLREGQEERAFMHLVKGHQWDQAIKILQKSGRDFVYSGQGRRFKQYVELFPPAYREHPDIYIALGDEQRFSCNYYHALEFYQKAEQVYLAEDDTEGLSKAYRSMAEIYLDIIQPAQAQVFLRKTYKTLGGKDHRDKAVILGLMAENMINQGMPRRAERYRQLARQSAYFQDNNNLEARILLRTGKYVDAIKILEQARSNEAQDQYHIPCSFRETPLILSVCYSYIGNSEKALTEAQKGIELGEKMFSSFVKVVGYVRMGHAYLIANPRNLAKSREAYGKAREIANNLGISRGFTEILQGECILHALEGNWTEAKSCGIDALKLTVKVKDRWFAAIMYHTLGMAAAICGVYGEARSYLNQSLASFDVCGDAFGQAVSTWWQCYVAMEVNCAEDFQSAYDRLEKLNEKVSVQSIIKRPSFLGDVRGIGQKPFLEYAAQVGILAVPSIDSGIRLQVVRQKPLQVVTLGQFRVLLGNQEIHLRDWKRESSKRLFFLFLTMRHSLLHKETIMSYLWPESDFEAALRYFKVALSNLMSVLEPDRQPRKPSAYIERDGATYRFRAIGQFELDVDQFETKLKQGLALVHNQPTEAETLLKQAVEIYKGDYLEGITQDEWCINERDRLVTQYIKAAENIARLLLSKEQYDESLQWADLILKQDRCWEKAYQLKLKCYSKLNNSVMIARTYKKCCEVLNQELGVSPSSETSKYYRVRI